VQTIWCEAYSSGNASFGWSSTYCDGIAYLFEQATLQKYSDPPGYYATVNSDSSADLSTFDIATVSNGYGAGYYLVLGYHSGCPFPSGSCSATTSFGYFYVA
jgi:hypothetical protein